MEIVGFRNQRSLHFGRNDCGRLNSGWMGRKCYTFSGETKNSENNVYEFIMKVERDRGKMKRKLKFDPGFKPIIAPDRYELGTWKDQDDLFMRGYNLIDGHHRIAKAHNLGKKTMKAYVVRMEQHLPFMLYGYKEYVEYWNEKLDHV